MEREEAIESALLRQHHPDERAQGLDSPRPSLFSLRKNGAPVAGTPFAELPALAQSLRRRGLRRRDLNLPLLALLAALLGFLSGLFPGLLDCLLYGFL
jgi:hypothetical protein